MPDDTREQILAGRLHATYKARQPKLYLNALALSGGRPYVEQRLRRFPAESSVDWSGASADVSESRFANAGAIKASGRKERAYLVNRCGRVAEKIRQYVFAVKPDRSGVPPELARDINRRGESLNAFMGKVLCHIVATDWSWIGVDAPVVDGVMTLARKTDEKFRPYWNHYPALDVVDWHFNDAGVLEWLITETDKYENKDPFAPAVETPVRRLWEPGKVSELAVKLNAAGDREPDGKITEIKTDFSVVPFTPVGEISPDPHFYDDLEDQQAAILDLESCLDTLYHKVVFAQLILPESAADDVSAESGGAQTQKKFAAIAGYSNAFIESAEDKSITRFIGPPAAAIGVMQAELGRKSSQFFDTIGLHLGFSRQFSESKEATKIDHLDPQSVLRGFSQKLVEAETRAWELTNAIDSSIPVVVPRYADNFAVTNVYEDWKSLVLASQLDAPPEFQRLILEGALDAALKITNLNLSEEEMAAIQNAIKDYDFSAGVPVDLERIGDGVENQATDDGSGERPSGG